VADTSGSTAIARAASTLGAVQVSSLNNMAGVAAAFDFAGAPDLQFTPAASSPSDLAPAVAPGTPSPASAGTVREAFGISANSSVVRSSRSRVAGPAHGILSAPVVDAMFAIDGLLSQGGV
jgi:hypothetical protein